MDNLCQFWPSVKFILIVHVRNKGGFFSPNFVFSMVGPDP